MTQLVNDNDKIQTLIFCYHSTIILDQENEYAIDKISKQLIVCMRHVYVFFVPGGLHYSF